MKILHVENGRHVYGGARQVLYLLSELHKLGVEQVMVCPDDSAVLDAVPPETAKCLPLSMRGGDVDLGYGLRLARLIRQEQPDLVHVHSRRGDWLGGVAAALARTPCILSRRVDNPISSPDRWLKYPLFRSVISISEGIRTVLIRQGISAARIQCVRSAVDTRRFRPWEGKDYLRQTLGIAATVKTVGIIAQLIPRKGHRLLFQVFPDVMQRHPDVCLLVFGQGPLEAELKQYVVARRLQDQVRFVGFRTDMAQMMPGLDLVVHPALMEGLGVSLLESAACGVPIVASAVGGIPEIVREGENGLLVEPGRPQPLLSALNRLLADDTLRQSMGQAGRVITERDFSIEAMAAGNYTVYQSVLDGLSTSARN